MRDESKEYVVDTSGIHRFAAKTENYFIAIEEKSLGHVFYSFDGAIFITHYVEKDHSAISKYDCVHF